MTGITQSTDFEGRNNAHHGDEWDAFALKVGPSGQLDWMTYLGGSDLERATSIVADADDNALVAGRTTSMDFNGRNNSFKGGEYDAFALMVSPSGQSQWMTYLGGSGEDRARGIAVDGAGTALLAGSTDSPDFEGRNNSHHGGQEDAFLVKLRLAQSEIVCADTFTQFRGIPIDGDFAETCGSDDVRWMHQPDALAATVVPPIDIEFEGALASDSGSAIRFVVEVFATETGVALRMSIFNFATSQFEGAVFPTIPTEDTEHVIERLSNVADYIGPNGEVRGRISYIRPEGVPPFWTIGIDEVRFEVDQ